MNTPHKHAELIKKWADGAVIEIKTMTSTSYGPAGTWVGLSQEHITWLPTREYRIKPEVTTSLSDEQLYAISTEVWRARCNSADPLDTTYRAHRAVADAAIKQYIKEQGK